VLFDIFLNWDKTQRIALAAAAQASPEALEIVASLFARLGKPASPINDIPGLVTLRTMAMLANEGSEAVLHQVCDAAGVDTAMKAGANYPVGPMAWADDFGPKRLLTALEHLMQAYGEDRYRPSSLLRRIVAADTTYLPKAH
jgi:3-hydroxybutyryl-CoA dehydrogenase